MHLPHSPDLTVRQSAPIRVGRLVPLDGIPPGALLQRAGYSTENVESEEILLQRLGNQCTDCSAVVLDATCSGVTLGGFVDALRAQGFGGKIVRCLPAAAEASSLVFVDAVLPATFTGELLLAAIAREATPPPAG